MAEETTREPQAPAVSRRAGTGRDLPPPWRVPLLMLGFFSLLLGLAAGVARLGWSLPLPSPHLMLLHGPLMASGFFGTVIGLERAVALGSRWAYLGPLATGSGGAALVFGTIVTGATLMAFGSLGLVAASYAVWHRQRAIFTATMLAGAVAWLAGNLLWLAGAPVVVAVPWWAAFLVLTIAGERLELSRFLPPAPGATRLFGLIVTTLFIAVVLGWLAPPAGRILLTASFMALTIWLWRYDVARRTIGQQGLARFIAVCVLSGYAWLGAGTLIGLFGGGLFSAGVYDETVHSVFLGFVFAMVFGHAPIIFPAVVRVPVPYHPLFYAHLALLHLGLLGRFAGDLLDLADLRLWSGGLNAATIILFILNTVAAVIRGVRQRGSSRA